MLIYVLVQCSMSLLKSYGTVYSKWFEPRGISYLFGVVVRMKVVFRQTVVWKEYSLSKDYCTFTRMITPNN